MSFHRVKTPAVYMYRPPIIRFLGLTFEGGTQEAGVFFILYSYL